MSEAPFASLAAMALKLGSFEPEDKLQMLLIKYCKKVLKTLIKETKQYG